MADPKRDRKKEYEDYLLNYAVNKGEGQQFEDDVKRGPPYTSRGFAIGQNEGRVERAPPSYAKGGPIRKPLDENDPRVKSQLWQVRNPGEWERPRGPNDTLHQKEEDDAPNYAKGGQVGRVGGFGMKRSKPDFAGGGGMLNRRSYTKPGR